ncbi:hypothetical protein [Streptomyces pseudogriseolus]|uniref:hypothetical protein n=1 Tax=Streptomyces pseudogriseolus TaxID=36817 RepID=UPI003FA1C6A9
MAVRRAGLLVSAGPRGAYVLHPGDVMDLAPHPDAGRHGGCCGPDGRVEVNRVCGCGAEAAIACADCTSGHEIRLMRDAVFPGSRSAFTAPWQQPAATRHASAGRLHPTRPRGARPRRESASPRAVRRPAWSPRVSPCRPRRPHRETGGEWAGAVCQNSPVLSFATIIGSRRAGPQ